MFPSWAWLVMRTAHGSVEGQAEKLLVEVVAPAADGLGQGEGGGDDVQKRREGDVHPAGGQPPAEDAAGYATPDAETAVPYLEDLGRVTAGVLLPAGGHRVQAGADQARHHGPEGDRDHRAGEAAQLHPAALRQPRRGEHPDGDEQSVEVELEGPNGDAVGRRARDVADHVVAPG